MRSMRRQAFGGGSRRRLVALIVAVVVVAAAGLLYLSSRGDDPQPAAILVIEADDAVCWSATLPTLPGQPDAAPQEGCGPSNFTIAGGDDRTSTIARTGGDGTLTAVVEVDGEEADRQSTDEANGIVSVTP